MNNSLIIALALCLVRAKEGWLILTQVRSEEGPLNGMIEFPGGKLEIGESIEDAARRECYEETGIKAPDNGILFKVYQHEYTDRSVRLFPVLFFVNEENLAFGDWKNINELIAPDMLDKIPAANISIVKDVINYLDKEEESINAFGY